MKAVIQRVKRASVTIENELYSQIDQGILVLFGVEKDDTLEKVEFFANKICDLRIFEDNNGKMNLSINDVKGEMLVVSQFTLAGDCKKGKRPSFDNAANPEKAIKLYEDFVKLVKNKQILVKTGKFRAMMNVELVNDGPVTFILEK
jgi:D-tyrosyl-tRNA(Tyr) deacylase